MSWCRGTERFDKMGQKQYEEGTDVRRVQQKKSVVEERGYSPSVCVYLNCQNMLEYFDCHFIINVFWEINGNFEILTK